MKLAASLFVLFALAGEASATAPPSFTFQGVLRNNMGQLQSMTLNGSVNLWNAQSGGSMLGPGHGFSNVGAQNGLFTVTVTDASVVSELAGATQVWIEIVLNGIGTFPRQQVTSAIYSLESSSADSLAAGYVVPIANGGTGSSMQNFVDLTSPQTNIGGTKGFTGLVSINGPQLGQFTVSGAGFTPLYVQNTNGPSGRACFFDGGVNVTGQLMAGGTTSVFGGEPFYSVGATSGVSMDDRLTAGAPDRWVIYPSGAVLRFFFGGTNGDLFWFSSNGDAYKPGGGSWFVLSDERLKSVGGAFTRGLKDLMRLEPIRYRYRPDNAMHASPASEHIGFGAQSVQKVIPEAVLTNSDGYLMVDNDPIFWTMLNGIKEQQREIEQLRADNAELRERLDRIQRTVAALNPKGTVAQPR